MIPHIAEHHEGGIHAKAAEFLIVPERHSHHHLQQNLRLLVQDALLLLLLRILPFSPALRISPSARRALLPPFRSVPGGVAAPLPVAIVLLLPVVLGLLLLGGRARADSSPGGKSQKSKLVLGNRCPLAVVHLHGARHVGPESNTRG